MQTAKSKSECVRAICRFPLLYSEGDLTPNEIVARSRYWDFRDEIAIQDIEDEIRSAPEVVDQWLRFTDDKRWTPAWGLSQDQNEFRLFYVFRDGRTEIEKTYEDGCTACARLVRLEMEGIRIGG